jgi:predicted nucleic acid-binding protein
VKFWDASAIIPLCFKEPASKAVKHVLDADPDIIVWWGTRMECLSALARRIREGAIGTPTEAHVKGILSSLYAEWSEVQPNEVVRQRAERLLRLHPLRASDAFQLASAVIWAQESPAGLDIVCLDQNLRQAASREGFTVLP